MSTLLSQIDGLTDAELVEVACYYLAGTFDAKSEDDLEELRVEACEELDANVSSLWQLRRALKEDRESYRKLLAFLLRLAARGTVLEQQRLGQAIAGCGKKQVASVLALAIGLSTLAAIQLFHHTKGKKKEIRKAIIETRPDGTFTWSVEEEVVYADSATALGRLLGWLGEVFRGKQDDAG